VKSPPMLYWTRFLTRQVRSPIGLCCAMCSADARAALASSVAGTTVSAAPSR